MRCSSDDETRRFRSLLSSPLREMEPFRTRRAEVRTVISSDDEPCGRIRSQPPLVTARLLSSPRSLREMEPLRARWDGPEAPAFHATIVVAILVVAVIAGIQVDVSSFCIYLYRTEPTTTATRPPGEPGRWRPDRIDGPNDDDDNDDDSSWEVVRPRRGTPTRTRRGSSTGGRELRRRQRRRRGRPALG